MRAAWITGTALFLFIILGTIAIDYRARHPQVPLSRGPKNCLCTAPRNETANVRFERKGGRRTTYVKVWRDGNALTIADVAEGRDLRKYDKLGLIDPEPRVASDRRMDPLLAQARQFLLQHWRDKKRAYLTLTLSSVDATSTSHVFVEKDELGRWRVYWRIVRHDGEVDDAPTDYDVKWVHLNTWKQPGIPLDSDGEPDPVRDRLEFRDVCGDFESSL